jgi:xylulose-5-phosphate/fructose-6-phosphate phosphoketolase
MARCGDVPTLETLAAVSIIRDESPDLRPRVACRRPDAAAAAQRTPHGLADAALDALVIHEQMLVIFAFHAPG